MADQNLILSESIRDIMKGLKCSKCGCSSFSIDGIKELNENHITVSLKCKECGINNQCSVSVSDIISVQENMDGIINDHNDMFEEPDMKEIFDMIWNKGLTRQQACVMVLRRTYSLKEVASMLGISSQTVFSAQKVAAQKLLDYNSEEILGKEEKTD